VLVVIPQLQRDEVVVLLRSGHHAFPCDIPLHPMLSDRLRPAAEDPFAGPNHHIHIPLPESRPCLGGNSSDGDHLEVRYIINCRNCSPSLEDAFAFGLALVQARKAALVQSAAAVQQAGVFALLPAQRRRGACVDFLLHRLQLLDRFLKQAVVAADVKFRVLLDGRGQFGRPAWECG
jgi:hypothetical protein